MFRYIKFLAIVVILNTELYAAHSYENYSLDTLLSELSIAQNKYDTIDVYLKLATYYVNTDINKAEAYANCVLDISTKINYEKGIADGNYSLARVYLNSHFNISFNFTLKALDYYEEVGDRYKIAKCLNLISIIKSNIDEFESALEYSEQVLEISLEIGDSTLYAMVLNNIGTYHEVADGNSEALDYYFKAAEVNKKTKHFMFLSINYGNIATAKLEDGDVALGREFLRKSYELKKRIEDKEGMGWYYDTYAQLMEEEGKFDSAIMYLHKSIYTCKYFNNKYQLEATINSIQKLYETMNQVDSAYFWLQELSALQDSIYNKERTKSIYLYEINQKYIQKQEIINLKHNAQIFKMAFVISVLGVFVLITIFIIYVLNNRRKIILIEKEKSRIEKEKLEEELVLKNQELTTYVMNLVNNNQMIGKVVEKLNSSIDDFKTEKNKVTIRKIASELSFSLNKDIWKEFEIRFNQVHPNFHNKLLIDFPDLTPNELKLCSFLKMNMSSKEISQITYQSVQSIEKARSRLRKKINLTNTDILFAYFLSKY